MHKINAILTIFFIRKTREAALFSCRKVFVIIKYFFTIGGYFLVLSLERRGHHERVLSHDGS